VSFYLFNLKIELQSANFEGVLKFQLFYVQYISSSPFHFPLHHKPVKNKLVHAIFSIVAVILILFGYSVPSREDRGKRVNLPNRPYVQGNPS